eukprot:CAMPEP_0175096900 /NCGR_PEP_ID=MMETSP0086_2-20121207/4985_1 /TAXON_ID=136419 /ORGANISM="Unknown Unknown, Strain D1" /LENGTH=896 /DNA_ID=CAMNT_0016370345 /DNA_START=28 /DNA_END=2718 /DNA_ORIENTATION=+
MVKTGIQPTRPHDHVYDPVYTVSNMNVHLQEHQKARMTGVERVPQFPNMFSDVATHPRHAYRMKESTIQINPLPPQGNLRHVPDSSILGQQRFKYFKRPVVPFLHSVPAEILLAPAHDADNNPLEAPLEAAEEPTRTIGIQTMYREGETQTDPYTPDYITNPGQDDPEILNLAHLTYGQGLPASLEEINMIHRMREKKAFEDSLPPITDDASFELRKKLLEEREMQEWAIREQEMKKEQEDKLQILIDTLKAREEKSLLLSEARIEKLRQDKMIERDAAFEKINQGRIKTTRVLQKYRPHQEQTSNKRDIIEEHADFSSVVYAPVAREGRLPVKNQVVDYGIPLISNYQGLVALENSLPPQSLNPTFKQPEKIIPKSAQGRKGQQIVADLAYVDKLLENRKTETKKVVIENVYKKFEPVTRAPTPSVKCPEGSDTHRAVLLLQRLLRGRAVQNSMYEGKQKALHLIHELRIAEDPPTEAPAVTEATQLDNAMDTLQGEVIAKAIDFISKEIVRVSEEKKIACLVKKATYTRRIREAEESGRRQAEDILRKKRAQYFEDAMDVHAGTAHRFLDEVFTSAVSTVATRTANKQSALRSEFINVLSEKTEQKVDNEEEVVADLFSTFIVPEVERQRLAREEAIKKRRFVTAAYDAAQSIFAGVQRQFPGTMDLAVGEDEDSKLVNPHLKPKTPPKPKAQQAAPAPVEQPKTPAPDVLPEPAVPEPAESPEEFEYCPMTMGMQCKYDRGVCKLCNRKEKVESQAKKNQPDDQTCPATFGKACQFKDGFCELCLCSDPSGSINRDTPSPRSCPATLGKPCQYENGTCQMCNGLEEPPQQDRSDSSESDKTCPATFGAPCVFKDGICEYCSQPGTENEANQSAVAGGKADPEPAAAAEENDIA